MKYFQHSKYPLTQHTDLDPDPFLERTSLTLATSVKTSAGSRTELELQEYDKKNVLV